MVRNAWCHWLVRSTEKLEFSSCHAVVFGRIEKDYYESVVYLPYEVTKRQAKELFGDVLFYDKIGESISLRLAMAMFGPQGGWCDAFDYFDKF